MPFQLFKKSEQELEPAPQLVPPGGQVLKEGPLLATWYILYRLEEEAERARRYGRPLSVAVAAAPTMFVGDRLSPEALTAAIEAAQAAARSTDLLGWLAEDSFLMVMPETPQVDAEAAVSRWRNEMWLRSRSLGGQKWHIAVLPSPVGFDSAEAFVESIPDMLAQKEAA